MPLFHKRNRVKSVALSAVSVIPTTRRYTTPESDPLIVGDLYLVTVVDLVLAITEVPPYDVRQTLCRGPRHFHYSGTPRLGFVNLAYGLRVPGTQADLHFVVPVK